MQWQAAEAFLGLEHRDGGARPFVDQMLEYLTLSQSTSFKADGGYILTCRSQHASQQHRFLTKQSSL